MIAVFLPLVVLAFATLQFEGRLAFFPLAFLVFWLGVTWAIWFFWLPKRLWRADQANGFDVLLATQNRIQWFNAGWVVLLQVFTDPPRFLFPWLNQIFPQTWPMLVSTALYLFLMWGGSGIFHQSFRAYLDTSQTHAEYFRARLTLPILFFPPMLLWMGVEDLMANLSGFSYMADVWTLGIAPLFFIGLYLLSPYLFNLAWKASSLQDEKLNEEIRKLAEKSRTAIAGVKVWDTFKEPLANAAVAGLADRYRFVYVTQFLMDILTPREVIAVIAHELAHFRLGHVWTYLIFTLDLVFASVAFKLYLFLHYPRLADQYLEYATYIDPIFFLVGFLVVFTALTRLSERQADRFAASMVGSEEFAGAMENLQEHIGTPQRRLPKWMETHPDFEERIVEARRWCGDPESLLRTARRIRWALVAMALVIVFQIFPQARVALQFSNAGALIENRNFSQAGEILEGLEKEVRRHPKVIELYGKVYMANRQWVLAGLAAAEITWDFPGLTPLRSQEFHHAVPPEVAFQFEIVKFLLEAFDLGGVHGMSLLDEGFDLFKVMFGH